MFERFRKRDFLIELTDKTVLVSRDNPREIVAEADFDQIQKVVAFKRDAWAVDLICLQIYTTDGMFFEVNEEIAGWTRLVYRLPDVLPGFPEHNEWFGKVAFPPFVPNVTTLFDRTGA